MFTVADLNLSNDELTTVILVLGIVALIFYLFGARPWRRG